METIEIAAGTNHRYVMPTGVMMHSVCRNNEAVRFHVIVDESITEEDKANLREAVLSQEVQFYTVDSRLFDTMPLLPGIPPATYYRLLVPRILPESIHKILFLDGDIIIRHSLLPLWETDIDGYAVAAAPDTLEADIGVYNRLRYPPDLGYFNGGVMLMNLFFWRENNVVGEIEFFIRNHSDRIFYCDQDVLNYVLRKKKKTLPIKYNTLSSYLWVLEKAGYNYWKYERDVIEARKDPVIIHYSSLIKPWMEGSVHPFNSSFIKYQDETKWKGEVWKKRKRPFMTKLLCHTNDALMKILTKTGLWKPPFKEPENSFLDLEPVD